MTQAGTDASLFTPHESWLRAAAEPSTPATALGLPPLRPGALACGDRFVIGAVLGQGGMGIVYGAHDLLRDETVALKALLDTHPARLLAFKHEFRALCDVRDPNLVQVGELFEDGGRWVFTMERIDGVPFTRFVREGGLSLDRLRSALAQLARGLGLLHGLGKVHRDVKPSNVLVEPGGRLVLLDFGLILDVSAPDRARHVRAGTAAYMAPEQLDGRAGPASDLYSVGVMLYEALTGALPFDGEPESALAWKAAQEPPPLSHHGVDAPPDLEDLCLALLEREPSRRPAAREVVERLTRTAPDVRRLPASSGSIAARGSVELTFITRAFHGARAGGARGLWVRGESGTGKTALLASFAETLGNRAEVLAARCHERERVPFNAVDGVIDALARYLDVLDAVELEAVLPRDVSALGRLFPVLAALGERVGREQGSEPSPEPHDARPRAFAALRELFRRIGAERPLAVVIDGLHVADHDSLALIESIVSGPDAPCVFWLLAARSGFEVPCGPPLAELPVLRLEPPVRARREQRQP